MSLEAMRWAWKQQGLTAAQKLVLLLLSDRASHEGKCWPSVSSICFDTGLSERCVQSALKELETKKLIKREARDGRATIYWLDTAIYAPPKNMHPRKICTPQNIHPAEYAELPPQNMQTTPAEYAELPPQNMHPEPKDESKNKSKNESKASPPTPQGEVGGLNLGPSSNSQPVDETEPQSTTPSQTFQPVQKDQQIVEPKKETSSQKKESPKPKQTKSPALSLEQYEAMVDGYTTNADLKSELIDFYQSRINVKHALTEMATTRLFKALDKNSLNDDGIKILMLQKAILNEWRGVFPLNNDELRRYRAEQQAAGLALNNQAPLDNHFGQQYGQRTHMQQTNYELSQTGLSSYEQMRQFHEEAKRKLEAEARERFAQRNQQPTSI